MTRATETTRLETIKRWMYEAMPFMPALWEMARPDFEAGGRVVKVIMEFHVVYMTFDNALMKWLIASLISPLPWLGVSAFALVMALLLYRREHNHEQPCKHNDPDPGKEAAII